MSSRVAGFHLQVAGQARLAAAVVLQLAAIVASAGEPVAAVTASVPASDAVNLSSAETLADLGQAGFSFTSAFLPSEMAAAEGAAEAPAYELSEGLGVRVEQGRRAFRARAMDWFTQRSVAVAHVADFFVGGADSGWHLTVDPRGDDEYQLQWKARFR